MKIYKNYEKYINQIYEITILTHNSITYNSIIIDKTIFSLLSPVPARCAICSHYFDVFLISPLLILYFSFFSLSFPFFFLIVLFSLMSAYSESNFNVQHYDAARPTYPDEFYTTLMNYHQPHNTQLAVDVGCGSGFVGLKLTQYFNKVIGTDISSTMVSQCLNRPKNPQNIDFIVAPAEQSPPEINPNSVDMITGAECCHWVDHQSFFKECYRILNPGGTLAYWFYKDPIFVDYPQANDIYNKYTLDKSEAELMGPLWQQPGRDYLDSLLKEVTVPESMFYDIIRHEYDPQQNPHKTTTLYIAKTVSLYQFKLYVTSWSAYHKWKLVFPHKKDIADEFIDELKEKMNWNDKTEVKIVWATVYTFARRR